jgi:DNA-binding FadR family transcriptional regulator
MLKSLILSESKNKKYNASNSQRLKDNIFKPVQKKRAFEEVSNEIKRFIFNGLLKRGDKLPSENELANRFNVGRQTIREALRYLELSGFITTIKGGAGGAVIVDTILNTISNSMLDAIQMKKISLHELVTARLEVEKIVLQQVILHCDDSDIEALKNNVSEAKKRIANKKVAFFNNVQFHKILARASKNYLFVVMMEPIMAMTADLLSRRQSNLRLSSKVVAEHAELIDAITRRDKAKAFTLLEKHLLSIEKRMAPLSKRDNM